MIHGGEMWKNQSLPISSVCTDNALTQKKIHIKKKERKKEITYDMGNKWIL